MQSVPKYIRVSQTILDYHKGSMTVSSLVDTALDIGKQQHVQLSSTLPVLNWGSLIYEIQDDGSLKLLMHKVDTSD